MLTRIHRPLRLKTDLKVEALEARIAPAVVLTDGTSFQYNAADGDLVEATFFGRGSAVLSNSTGADPGTPGDENLWYVDLVNTDTTSQLYIRDVTPGDGSDNLILHQVANMGGGSMGVIDLSAPGQVRFADINLTCPLQSVNIHGALYLGSVTTTGSVKSITIDRFAEISSFDIGGDLGSFSTGGGTLQGSFNVAGHLGSALITGGDMIGTRVNVGSGCDRFEIYGNTWCNPFTASAAEFVFYSGVQTFAVYGDMVGTTFQSISGNVGKFYVQGTVRNEPVGIAPVSTSIDLMNGKCGQIYIGGDLLLDSSGGPSSTAITCSGMRTGKIEIGGSVIGGADITAVNGGRCGSLTIGGDLLGDVPGTDRATITTINGNAGGILVRGNTDYAQITCQSGNQSKITIEGSVNDTTIALNMGTTGTFRIAGDVTNSAIIAQDHTLRKLWIGGNLNAGSAVQATYGALYQTTVQGDILGGSQLNLVGIAGSSVSVGGSVDNSSSVTLAFTAMRNLSIGGAVDRGSIVIVTGSDVSRIRIGGGVLDGSQVVSSLGALRDLFIGGSVDSLGGAMPMITFGSTTAGNLTIAGHVFEGFIVAGSSGLHPGDKVRIFGDITDSTVNLGSTSAISAFEIGGNVSGSTFIFTMTAGVDRLSIAGNVGTSAFTFTGPCGPTAIGGSVDTVTWTVGGPHASFRCRDFANQFTYVAVGPVGSFRIGGPATNTGLTFIGACDSLRIDGPATNVNVDWSAPMGMLSILGDVDTVALIGIGGGVDRCTVTGNATNFTLAVSGQTGMTSIKGSLDAGLLSLDGMTDTCRVSGAVTNTTFIFSEHVGRIQLGSMSSTQIDITNTFPPSAPGSGGADRIVVQGDVDTASSIIVFGPCGSTSIQGDVLDSTFIFNSGLGRLDVLGRMEDSGITIMTGGAGTSLSDANPTVGVRGGLWGATVIQMVSDCSRLQIGQGMNDTSEVRIAGYASSVTIGGHMAAGTNVIVGGLAVSGSGLGYYTGTLKRMTVRGLIYGNIQVSGTLHAVNSAGAAGQPYLPGPPFSGGFLTTDRTGAPIGGHVDYITLAPGGYVS